MENISSSKAMKEIVNKFIYIVRCKKAKVSCDEDAYVISYDKYTLAVDKEDNYIHLLFTCNNKNICHYECSSKTDKKLYSQVCDRLLAYIDEELLSDENMKVVEDFLYNN